MFGMEKKGEFKKQVREATRLLLLLDKTLLEKPAPGYSRNAFGQYWKTSVLEDWLEAQRSVIALTDLKERQAAKYSMAATLRKALRLDEAAALCAELIDEYPQAAAPSLNLLAYIEARRGNIERARELAVAIQNNPNPTMAFFRLREEDIQREYAEGRFGALD